MFASSIRKAARAAGHGIRSPWRLNRDERGTISIISVFAAMLLTMLLGMVLNVGRQVDGKIRMQNAADASAYSGALVLTRGMNTLAFTNHLLSEVFAMTAFLREARDRNAETYVPEILAGWTKAGRVLARSGFPKFDRLGQAIVVTVPQQQDLVTTYSDWVAAVSALSLPLMETILQDELIPQYQRAVVAAFPDIAQTAAMEVARRNGRPEHGRGEMLGVLWRTSVVPVGGAGETGDPSLPVVDPVLGAMPNQAQYLATARKHRRKLAKHYLGRWNSRTLVIFDRFGKMSQFAALWRSFTCGYLDQLLDEEYPDSNLPFVIRTPADQVVDTTAHLDEEFTFVGVVYWKKLPGILPRLFRSPIEGDALTYAEVRVFVPLPRLVWKHRVPGSSRIHLGGVPGESVFTTPTPPPAPTPAPTPTPNDYWYIERQSVPSNWDLRNQHWTCQLVPATTPRLVEILQTVPPFVEFATAELTLPNLGNLATEDIQQISPH